MIFRTFTADQGYGNNRCSGYALAPVCAEIFRLRRDEAEHGGTQPLGERIYDKLRACQAELLSGHTEREASVRFVRSPANVFNGTCMILPSGIVAYCLSLGWDVKVFCSDREAGIFGPEVFGEDSLRMKGHLRQVKGYAALLHEVSRFRYLLALTRSRHWVSLKRSDEGYYLYDPAPAEFQGGMYGPGSLEELLPQTKGHPAGRFFNGLAIGIADSR